MEYLKIINLDKYQKGAKDKPWIKWWKRSLHDYKNFLKLTDSQRWLYIGIVMLAVDLDNCIPYDIPWIAERVAYRCRGRCTKVRLGVLRMIEFKLISVKKDPIREDKIIKEEKENNNLNNLKDETADKREEVRTFLKEKGILKSIKQA